MNVNLPQSLDAIQTQLGDLLTTRIPTALLPVRLETRFTHAADKVYLCVRVFPDDIHVDTHEPLLTDDEVRWGKQLWEQIWLSGRDPAMEKAIQDELAERFGPGRAAWIAKTLKPLNPEDRSDEPNQLPVKPLFPEVATRPDTWTRPPELKAMPRYWVLFAYRPDKTVLTAISNRVANNLKAGFDPLDPVPGVEDELLEQRDDNEVLPLDKGVKWMVDFEEAVARGMGFRIELSSRAEAETGFDRIMVIGVDSSSTASQRLETLLKSQRYTDSLDFVPQGSPSNNTEEARSRYAETEPEQTTEFLSQTQTLSGTPDCNCEIAATALGIAPETFANLPHSLDREQADARAMNTALWPATWGYFFRYILGHAESHLSDETIESLRSCFMKFVRARGPIPILRVGHQPYGILPVTSLENFLPDPADENEVFDTQGISILQKLRDRWRDSLVNVPRVAPRYDLRFMSGATADDLLIEGNSLVIVAEVGADLHIRIFNGDGTMIVDSAAEALVEEETEADLEELRNLLNPFPDESLLSHTAKKKIFKSATSLAGLIPSTTTDLDETLAEILGMLPVSNTTLGRMALDSILYGVPAPGPNGLSVNQDSALAALRSNAIAQLNELDATLNLNGDSIPGAALAFTEPILKLSSNLQNPELETAAPPFQKILSASFPQLSNGIFTDKEQKNPLTLLLRHSMLLAYLDTAYHLNRIKGNIQPENHRDPSLVGILSDPDTGDAENTPTLAKLLELSIDDQLKQLLELPGLETGTALRDIINTLDTSPHSSTQIIRDLKQSLNHLATVSPDQLGELVGETLDLASHRLDAWITALATTRLNFMRKTQKGIILGGYGWVENLKLPPSSEESPDSFGHRVPVQSVPDGESNNGQSLYENETNGGYIAAPSLNQAATAAILRSGYLNHGSRQADDPFAINLSSDRVRLAKWLLDGVRQGQALSALLGYRFERSLQEQGLAKYILPFRKFVPFSDAATSDDTVVNNYRDARFAPETLDKATIESIESQHVVDGLALMRLRQEKDNFFGSGEHLIDIEVADQAQVEALLDNLVATVDAVSDLVTAESVYQLAQGNDLLAGSTLDAIAKGTTPPPDPEIVRTPRSGVAHTHRVPVIFCSEPPPLDGWNIDSFQRRANLEPHLNHWVSELLGDARRIKIHYAFWDRKTDTAIPGEAYGRLQSSFNLSPLDVIFLASTNETGTGSALEALMTYKLMFYRPARIPADATIRFFYNRDPDWQKDRIVSYGTLIELARAARELITNARPLDGSDVASPEDDTELIVDTDELRGRAIKMYVYFKQARDLLANALSSAKDGDYHLNNVRVAIVRFVYLGINEAVPLSARDDEPRAKELLLEQSQTILDEANRRLNALDDIEAGIDRNTASDAEKIEVDTKRIKIMFGQDFPVLPKFRPANAEALARTFADSTALQDQDPGAAMTWLTEVAHVRDGCNRLQTCLDYAEVLYPEFEMDYTVGQLPYQTGDRWIALPDAPTGPITEPRVSLMTIAPHGLQFDTPIAGLMVDEWVETIPNTRELAAAAFHFDSPQAQAPHSILLCIPPDITQDRWQLNTLSEIVQETLDLAKLRSVDNAALFAHSRNGHFLPAAYFAQNHDATDNPTVSTDFFPAAENITARVEPLLTSISPPSAYIGDSVLVTISGDNLAQAQSIKFRSPEDFSELLVNSVEIISNSEIRFNLIPQGNSGTRNFEVNTEHNGSAVSQNFGLNFKFKEKVLLNSLSPTSEFHGESFPLTVNGSNLSKVTEVRFTSSGLTVNSWSLVNDNQITCNVSISSSTSGGTKQLQLIAPDQTVPGSFTVKERPTLTSISPKSFPAGISEISFTVKGTRLLGATTVTFLNSAGTARNFDIGSRIVSVRSSTELACRLTIDRDATLGRSQFQVFIPTGKDGKVRNPNLYITVTEPIEEKEPPPGGEPL